MLTKKERSILDALMREGPCYEAYPGLLQKITLNSVTRAGAKLACKRLVRLGILEEVQKRSPTWSKSTPHYGMRKDSVAFTKLVQEYFGTLAKFDLSSWQSSTVIFMNSEYVRQQINSSLVREVLSSRRVGIRLLANMDMETKIRETEMDTASQPLRKRLPLCFPVMPADGSIENMKSKVTSLGNALSDEQKAFFSKAIQYHYSNTEERGLILPILALLEISPTALLFFLSDWKPYEPETETFYSGSQGLEMVEHVLFRLVWAAINDLSITRQVPSESNVRSANVCGGRWADSKTSTLLQLRWKDNELIEYEAGFDSEHDYYGDGEDIFEVETNPENCRVKVEWKKEKTLLDRPKQK